MLRIPEEGDEMKGGRKNDYERRLWVANHEPLYRLWKGSGLVLSRWVKENRGLIDEVIKEVLDRPPSR